MDGASGRFELYHLKPGVLDKYVDLRTPAKYETRIKLGVPLNLPGALMWPKRYPEKNDEAQRGALLLGRMIPFRWAGDGRYEATAKPPRGYAIWQTGNELFTTLISGEHATFVFDGQEFSVNLSKFSAGGLAFLDTETSEVFFLHQW